MFWFAFISIILFILFLVIVLVTTGRSTTDKTLRGLKEELEEKNKLLDAKKKKIKVTKEPRKRKLKPTVTEVLEESVVEEKVIAKEEPQVKEEVLIEEAEEVLAPSVEERNTTSEVPASTLEEEDRVEEIIDEVKEDVVEPSVEEPEETVTEIEEEPELPIVEEVVETPEIDEPEIETPEETLEVLVTPPVEIEEEESIPEPVASSLPYEYSVFDNARTMEEFGLSKEEADEFIVELITQVEGELPALEAAVEANDAKQIEDISHMVKGSATNLGTGGIADVLIDFNTYMKSDNDPAVIATHMANLRRALKELKEQFQ